MDRKWSKSELYRNRRSRPQRLLRDLDGVAEIYPDAHWPIQSADALRGLIHQANLTRDAGRDALDEQTKNMLIKRFRDGVWVGLSGAHQGHPTYVPATSGSPPAAVR